MVIDAEDYHNNLTRPGLFIEQTSDGQQTIRSQMSSLWHDSTASLLLDQAESFFAERNTEKARYLYKKILDRHPNSSQMMTYIGQTYQQDNDDESAREWFEKAIKTNRIDYMAHWFLANVCMEQNEIKRAVHHIVIAHVLNRNNPRIQLSLGLILLANDTPYDNWEFIPTYTLDTNKEGNPMITVAEENPDWMTYAMCKALWAFEPGYALSVLGDSKAPPALIEEKEALIALSVREIRKADKRSTLNEDIHRLAQIIKGGYLDAFALYEVVLRKDPNMASTLPEEVFDVFQRYILQYHTKKE